MNNKTDRRVLRTKKNIRTAFIQLINKKELDQITVTEISNLADIDRKTFYLHYNTVIDVYKDLENEISDELQTLLNADENLNCASFFMGLNKIMKKDFQFYKTIAQKNSYSFLINECTKLLSRKLKEKVSEGKSPISLTQQLKIEYASSGIIGLYINWLKSNQEIELDELVKVLSEMLEFALRQES